MTGVLPPLTLEFCWLLEMMDEVSEGDGGSNGVIGENKFNINRS